MMASIFNRVCLLEVFTVISMYCRKISYVRRWGLYKGKGKKTPAGKKTLSILKVRLTFNADFGLINMNIEQEKESILKYSEYIVLNDKKLVD